MIKQKVSENDSVSSAVHGKRFVGVLGEWNYPLSDRNDHWIDVPHSSKTDFFGLDIKCGLSIFSSKNDGAHLLPDSCLQLPKLDHHPFDLNWPCSLAVFFR